jgi:Protein of unknown function (DUF3237)
VTIPSACRQVHVTARSAQRCAPAIGSRTSCDIDHAAPAATREYRFRPSTRIEIAAHALDGLDKGVFVSVGARHATGVIYESYLVA